MARARFQAMPHLRAAAWATRLAACEIRPLARGTAAKAAPGKGPPDTRGCPTSPRKPLAAQDSQGPRLPASIPPPARGPALHGRARAALRRGGTRTSAAGPRLSPARPAPGCSQALYLLVVVPLLRWVCMRVRDCLQRDSALSGL